MKVLNLKSRVFCARVSSKGRARYLLPSQPDFSWETLLEVSRIFRDYAI